MPETGAWRDTDLPEPASHVCSEADEAQKLWMMLFVRLLRWSHTLKPVPRFTPVSEVEEEAGAVALIAVQGSSKLKVILERE